MRIPVGKTLDAASVAEGSCHKRICAIFFSQLAIYPQLAHAMSAASHAALYRDLMFHPLLMITTCGAFAMSKEQRSNKETKKKPLLNSKEKKALKKSKSTGKSDPFASIK